jgi:plastocyanin
LTVDNWEEEKVAKTVKISIKNMSFDPGNVTISVGDTVEWTNHMGMAHTVTPDNGEFPGSGRINSNKSFSHVFSARGTVPYHCEIHPNMTGTVIVG